MQGEALIFVCPHCNGTIEVLPQDIQCGIFRHGEGISPHASQIECEQMAERFPHLGCFRPFKVIAKPSEERVVIEKCDYI